MRTQDLPSKHNSLSFAPSLNWAAKLKKKKNRKQYLYTVYIYETPRESTNFKLKQIGLTALPGVYGRMNFEGNPWLASQAGKINMHANQRQNEQEQILLYN